MRSALIGFNRLFDGTNTHVYGLDLISSTDRSGNQTYFSYDALGSTSDLTNGSGTVTDTYTYDVWGAVKTHTGSNGSYWKFTGEQADDASGDSGYYFLRARYLDVATGRFISRDPVEFEQRYGYAGNNPMLNVDPSGLCRNPVSGGQRSWWRRSLDAADCVVDALEYPAKPLHEATVRVLNPSCVSAALGYAGGRLILIPEGRAQAGGAALILLSLPIGAISPGDDVGKGLFTVDTLLSPHGLLQMAEKARTAGAVFGSMSNVAGGLGCVWSLK